MNKRQTGSQSVEFALICLPFMVLLLAFIELSRFLLTNTLFEIAVTTASRDIRTSTQGVVSERKFLQRVGLFPLINIDDVNVKADYAFDLESLAKESFIEPSYQQSGKTARVATFTSNYQFQFLLIPQLTGSITEMVTFKKIALVTYE